MAIYKNSQTSTTNMKPTNLGVQKNDPQSLIDYVSGFNGDRFSFAAGEYDAVKGFFVNKGFAITSAESIAYIILRQARVDNVPVFQIIDQLAKTTTLELNEIIAEILNLNRFKTSVLGFKSAKESLS